MTKTSIVSKANAFIESGYAINLVAQRVIILAIIEAREQGSMSEIEVSTVSERLITGSILNVIKLLLIAH